jgi:hypothetical protein
MAGTSVIGGMIHCRIKPETANVLIVEFGHIIAHNPCSYQTINALLDGIVNAIRRDTGEMRFTFIEKEKVPYFDKGNGEPFCTDKPLFGEKVYESFKTARLDIRCAGTCLALDLYDSAVFHLMLAVNCGLLALARDLGVAPDKKPLEYEEWHILIRKIDDKLHDKAKLIQNTATAGKDKDRDLDFFQGLSARLKYIKDAHRNPIAHARGDYDDKKAKAVFGDVRLFMEQLATRVSE